MPTYLTQVVGEIGEVRKVPAPTFGRQATLRRLRLFSFDGADVRRNSDVSFFAGRQAGCRPHLLLS